MEEADEFRDRAVASEPANSANPNLEHTNKPSKVREEGELSSDDNDDDEDDDDVLFFKKP